MKIINLMGKKGSGKTYTAGELTKILLSEGYIIYNDTFASKLKNMIALYFGVRKNNFDDAITNIDDIKTNTYNMLVNSGKKPEALVPLIENIKNISKTIKSLIDKKDSRTLMQYIGTDIFRKGDEDYWTKNMRNKINNMPSISLNSISGKYWNPQIDFVIISDCRFINEFKMLNSLDNIKTYNILIKGIEKEDDNDNHRSEKEIDEIAKTEKIEIFNNTNDKTKFEESIKLLLKKITM